MNFLYVALALFLPPKKDFEMCGYESINQFLYIFSEDQIFKRARDLLSWLQEMFFSAMYIQIAAFSMNIKGSVDASKTLIQKNMS